MIDIHRSRRCPAAAVALLPLFALCHDGMMMALSLASAANGPSAMQKYAGDPEIMSVVKELQEILG